MNKKRLTCLASNSPAELCLTLTLLRWRCKTRLERLRGDVVRSGDFLVALRGCLVAVTRFHLLLVVLLLLLLSFFFSSVVGVAIVGMIVVIGCGFGVVVSKCFKFGVSLMSFWLSFG